MNRKILMCKNAVIGLSLVSISLTGCNNNAAKAQKPNIVFILADDLGWADLPIYGNKFNEAPRNIQSLGYLSSMQFVVSIVIVLSKIGCVATSLGSMI